MDAKTIITNLTRVRTLFDRKESFEAFQLLVSTLPGVIATPSLPVNARSLLREALQILSKDDLFKQYCPQGIAYQQGQERAIYTELKKVSTEIKEAQAIALREVTRKRKMDIDIHFTEGIKELAKGNVSEADACFAKAITFYHDEVSLYTMIGKAFLEVKEVRRAAAYLRKGNELAPADAALKKLLAEAIKQRQVT